MGEPKPKEPTPSSLAEVSAIEQGGMLPTARKDLKDIVELPLLAACETLYDKNIQTVFSSANRKDLLSGEAYIIIDFDSLSEENRAIARQYNEPFDYQGLRTIKITIPVNESMTLEEISQKAEAIADAFVQQPATWIPTYTLEDLKKIYNSPQGEAQYDDPNFWGNYYYDKATGRFYLSEEHYRKANE